MKIIQFLKKFFNSTKTNNDTIVINIDHLTFGNFRRKLDNYINIVVDKDYMSGWKDDIFDIYKKTYEWDDYHYEKIETFILIGRYFAKTNELVYDKSISQDFNQCVYDNLN